MPFVLDFGGGKPMMNGKFIGRVGIAWQSKKGKVERDFGILGALTLPCWQSKDRGCYKTRTHFYQGVSRPNIFQDVVSWKRLTTLTVPMFGRVCWLLKIFYKQAVFGELAWVHQYECWKTSGYWIILRIRCCFKLKMTNRNGESRT